MYYDLEYRYQQSASATYLRVRNNTLSQTVPNDKQVVKFVKSKKRLKPGHKFFITIEFPFIYRKVREDFLDYFEIEDNIIEYVVAVEKSLVSKKYQYEEDWYDNW